MHFHKFAFYLGGKRTEPICGHDISNLSLSLSFSHDVVTVRIYIYIYVCINDRENFPETTALASLNLEFSNEGWVCCACAEAGRVRVRVCRGPNFPKGCVSDGDVIVDSRCTYPIIYANFRVRVARFKGTPPPFSEILWVISPWESFGKYAFKRLFFLLLLFIRKCGDEFLSTADGKDWREIRGDASAIRE